VWKNRTQLPISSHSRQVGNVDGDSDVVTGGLVVGGFVAGGLVVGGFVTGGLAVGGLVTGCVGAIAIGFAFLALGFLSGKIIGDLFIGCFTGGIVGDTPLMSLSVLLIGSLFSSSSLFFLSFLSPPLP
jgi:hypothetical protein